MVYGDGLEILGHLHINRILHWLFDPILFVKFQQLKTSAK